MVVIFLVCENSYIYKFVYNYEDDGYEDNCGERVRFFMDELAILYTYHPPFFWDSNFEDFKYKMKRHISKGNGLS